MNINVKTYRDAIKARKKLSEFIALCRRDESCTAEDGTSFVDLGLASGTLWAAENARKDGRLHFTYDDAVEAFGESLPNVKQFCELKRECTWTWDFSRKGYKVTGKNGNSIFLPARGDFRGCSSGTAGYYWSSTPIGEEHARELVFGSFFVDPGQGARRGFGNSVRLVRPIRSQVEG